MSIQIFTTVIKPLILLCVYTVTDIDTFFSEYNMEITITLSYRLNVKGNFPEEITLNIKEFLHQDAYDVLMLIFSKMHFDYNSLNINSKQAIEEFFRGKRLHE